VYIIRGNTIWI